jgi:hypothetical protein
MMVMAQLWWLLPELKHWMSKKMPRVTWRLKELRCEGVEFNAFERMFYKDILSHLRHRTFHELK